MKNILQQKINEYLEMGVTHRALAKGTGLDWGTLQKIIDPPDGYELSAIKKIKKLCKYFKVPPNQVCGVGEEK